MYGLLIYGTDIEWPSALVIVHKGSGGTSRVVAPLTGMPPPKDELQLHFLALPSLFKHQL